MKAEEVKLYVGPNKILLKPSRYQLCKTIPYFEKIFKEERFEEARTGITFFPEDSPEAFDLLIEYADKGKFRDVYADRECKPGKGSLICEFYFLAEKLCLYLLQDVIMNAMRIGIESTNYP
jgi:hypothetical protein